MSGNLLLSMWSSTGLLWFVCAGGGAAGHFAAEILQKVLCDAALTNQILLTPHAPALQIALQAASGTGGVNYSRILEWVEAATVYEMKGAAGLLKYVGALIGPQNNIAGLHMDSSMDDDANNLLDRAPGSDLQMTKGMIAPLIQDSAVHALTVSLRLLASAAWNSVGAFTIVSQFQFLLVFLYKALGIYTDDMPS